MRSLCEPLSDASAAWATRLPVGCVSLYFGTNDWSALSVGAGLKPALAAGPATTASDAIRVICDLRLELVHLVQDVVDAELGHVGVDTLEADDTLFVDDEDRPVGRAALLVVNAVGPGDLALRVEVRQDGVGDVPQRRGEGRLRRSGVGADTQYLGSSLLECRVVLSERGDLVRSAACKREDVEGEDDVLLALILAHRHSFLRLGLEREVRSGLSNVYHVLPPMTTWSFLHSTGRQAQLSGFSARLTEKQKYSCS